MTSAEVRARLVDALQLDLIGPESNPAGQLGDPAEVLPQAPSRWYLTGFLVPYGARAEQRQDETADDDLDEAGEGGDGGDDAAPAERAAARRRFFPSSIGASVLVPGDSRVLRVTVRWGDYKRRPEEEGSPKEEWERTTREEQVEIDLAKATQKTIERPVPKSDGLFVAWLVRPVVALADDICLPKGTCTVSVFVVNRRAEKPDGIRDEAFAFQVSLEAHADREFLRRPDFRGTITEDWDEQVADLQYRNDGEYAVGHNVAAEAILEQGSDCKAVRTRWIPGAEVEKVVPADIAGVALAMDELASLANAEDAKARLEPLVKHYETWIEGQAKTVPSEPEYRCDTGAELIARARIAARRIQAGIDLLGDADCLEAFRLTNRCMAEAARRRLGVMAGKDPATMQPKWYPFQLAFLLMNLKAIANPESDERDVVDLLFFPTGGGKTEAYLGLAAFTLVLRRLRNPGIGSAGLSVLMRYTLRLLTFEQLSRAATLICALELERQKDVTKLGEWPFEIGLWVGKAATPNRMGKKGDKDDNSARARTIRFLNDDSRPSPIPLEECPWCGQKFNNKSFKLLPNANEPRELRISCMDEKRICAFGRDATLPILAVDEQIYRRLPCFLIATVDKFASLPWTAEVGAFFGRVQRGDKSGFYGPADPREGRNLPVEGLLPPDLIIQDELHLISGPLGTMAGLYESALDELCARLVGDRTVRPKIVASTATVRKADAQIRALFDRRSVDIFPPPGPDRKDSFFALTKPPSEQNARLYVGVAAQGRSPKVAMLRVYLALLGAGQKWYSTIKKSGAVTNAADPYLTLLGYFNSLRELGGARRLIEDEVQNRIALYGGRKRVGEQAGLFEDRKIGYEPVELTSRVNTAEVSRAKKRLAYPFENKEHVDVGIATNMISVGLDITRLGLMVVFGQPKSSSEYIQATSRVGRDASMPGLVVTILNVHKPRDRSHYERFAAYHETFYRSVEVMSVTPFSPRALDKGLAATLVGLVRHKHIPMTPPLGAKEILKERGKLDFAFKSLEGRARDHATDLSSEERDLLRARVHDRCVDLLDAWSKEAFEYEQHGTQLQYNKDESGGAKPLLYDFLSDEVKNLPPSNPKMKFRANRSLRDVEPSINLYVKTLDDKFLEDDAG